MRACLMILAMVLASLPTAQAKEDEPAAPRLVAVTVWSAFCGPCRVVEPRFERALDAFEAGQPDQNVVAVDRVRLDLTPGRRAAAATRAAEAGLSELYASLGESTGYIVLVDRETGDVLARLTMAYAPADMRGALEHAAAIIADRSAFGL